MISNGPSRTFTQDAVEAWFKRLCSTDWETFLFTGTIKTSTTILQEGYLSTIDIQESQAVITRKINRDETYSVVEWNGKGPEIRTSMEEEEGIAIATAGLYEIEELISELQEDNPLLGEGLKDSESGEEPDETEVNDSSQEINEPTAKAKNCLSVWKFLHRKDCVPFPSGKAIISMEYQFTTMRLPALRIVIAPPLCVS